MWWEKKIANNRYDRNSIDRNNWSPRVKILISLKILNSEHPTSVSSNGTVSVQSVFRCMSVSMMSNRLWRSVWNCQISSAKFIVYRTFSRSTYKRFVAAKTTAAALWKIVECNTDVAGYVARPVLSLRRRGARVWWAKLSEFPSMGFHSGTRVTLRDHSNFAVVLV